ncbi:LysR family transcriptional regulator [Klebsiella variicola]|uniref:LysR family transcriptional regulator n=1 Tax=Klebsiella variicola TaxID=244366 RepID=UPI0023700BA7|nr:LysR family transcriptional regulator [Klebsiella variicola]
MKRNLTSLLYFVTVARERSFTRAAAHLGVSQPALSHAIAELEKSTNIPLLSRTTRRVTPTENGQCLLHAIGSHVDKIQSELNKLSDLHIQHDRTLRINCPSLLVSAALMRKLHLFIIANPELRIELENAELPEAFIGDTFDAYIRLGPDKNKEWNSQPVSPPVRMAVVGSSAYFGHHNEPERPQDLSAHHCIRQIHNGEKQNSQWFFKKGDNKQDILVDGPIGCQAPAHLVTAVLSGAGLGYLPEGDVLSFIDRGQMKRVLEDWCEPLPGYHLCYSASKKASEPLLKLIDSLGEKSLS